jgi:hypothetical protein
LDFIHNSESLVLDNARIAPLCGSFSQRHHAIAPAFDQTHHKTMRGCIHIMNIELVNVGMADTGRVQDFS